MVGSSRCPNHPGREAVTRAGPAGDHPRDQIRSSSTCSSERGADFSGRVTRRPRARPRKRTTVIGLPTVDAASLASIRGHARGPIRHDARAVILACRVAQARLAFPGARITDAAGNCEAARAFNDSLKAIVPSTTSAPGICPEPAVPLVVTTISGPGADGGDLQRCNIPIVLDAPEGPRRCARLAISCASGSGPSDLIDRSRQDVACQRDRALALFGLDGFVEPHHGHVERPVEVAKLRVTGGPTRAPSGEGSEPKRRSTGVIRSAAGEPPCRQEI